MPTLHPACPLSTPPALLLTAGVRYPLAASVCGAIYLLGRILYFKVGVMPGHRALEMRRLGAAS